MKESELLRKIRRELPDKGDMEIVAVAGNELRARFTGKSLQFQKVSDNFSICIRVWRNNRPLVFTVNCLDDLAGAISQAKELAGGNDFTQSPLATKTGYKKMEMWDEETAEPELSAVEQHISPLLKLASNTGTDVAGRFSIQNNILAVVNTAGVSASCRATWVGFRSLFQTLDNRGSGLAVSSSRALSTLDSLSPSLEAVARCQAATDMRSLVPGEYTVIFEPPAVAQLVDLLAEGLGGQALANSKTPFLRLENKYLGANISLWDDGLDQRGMAMPFDFQGVPKRRINLFREGVLQNHVWDHMAAMGTDQESTGHASHPENSQWPRPAHLFLEPGNAMLDDMIVSTKRGILVSRLYKPHILDPSDLLVGGSIGWGALAIEDGMISGAVPGTDFTGNLVDWFNRVDMVGDTPRADGTIWSGTVVPALRIRGVELGGSESFDREG